MAQFASLLDATSAYITIQGNGTSVAPEQILNFVGADFTVADDPGNFRTNVTLPAMVHLAGSTMTGPLILSGDPVTGLQAATKEYVDSLSSGLSPRTSCRAATTAALTVTYNNGTSGVGATLTNAGSQAALVLDDVTMAVANRVLVKDQVSTFQNGIYTVTNIGSNSTNWVMTRATDYNTAASNGVVEGSYTVISEGTVNEANLYVETGSGPFTIGTTPIIFSAFNSAANISVTAPITKTGNVIGITTPLVGTYGGTGINNGSNTITLGGNVLTAGAFTTSGANPLTFTTTGSTGVTLPTSGTLVNTAVTTLSSLVSIGTITTGTWNGTLISSIYGGTGVNNGSNTITLAGNLVTSGANPLTFTTTGSTNVTLPTSGTLVPTTGTGATGTWGISISGNAATVTTNANLTGDVTSVGNATTIANNAVTYAKFQQVGANSLVGNATGVTANATSITLGSTLGFSGTALQTDNFTGDVTTSSNSFATTIANNAVSNAKFRQSAALSVVGNGTGSIANVADITGTTNQVLVVNNAGSALAFGAVNLASSSAVTGLLAGANGGTGVANTGKTITLGGNLTTSGAFDTTFTMAGATGVTFPTSGTLATTTSFSGKNLVIGGNFDTNPWQRGTSFATIIDGTYTADRWVYEKNGTMVHTVSQVADAPAVSTTNPYGTNCLNLALTTPQTSIGSGDYSVILQAIEGYNYALIAQNAFTLSFWVKATATGTYCVSFKNGGLDRSYVAEYTINTTNTWQYITINVPAPPSGGTWKYTTDVGLSINFTVACGSTFQTTAGSWASGNFFGSSNQINGVNTGDTNFRLAFVQLEAGNTATPFEYRTVQQELSLCQRYYEKSYQIVDAPGTATISGVHDTWVAANSIAIGGPYLINHPRFKVDKRVAPTITLWSDAGTVGSWYVNGYKASNAIQISTTTFVVNNNTGGIAVISLDFCYGHWSANADF